jgi:hypothetical protein
MKRIRFFLFLAGCLVLGYATPPALRLIADDTKTAVKSAPATIPIPEVDTLRWGNLRLDAQARQARSDALRLEAAALNDQAEKYILGKQQELCKAAGVDWEKYDIVATKDGGLELRLKKPPEAPKP